MALRRRLPAPLVLALIAIAFVALVWGSGLLLRGARVDLTANRLFTLSPGTEHLVAANKERIRLQFFASDRAMRDVPALRMYAQRVRELLEEIAARSHGTITLEVIDPQPYSEADDRAAGYGLQGLPVGDGSSLYFGLVGTNAHGGQSVAPFFEPSKEVFLEYDIAKLLTSLTDRHKPVVAILSSLATGPSLDPQTGAVKEGWAIDAELAKLYEVRRLQPHPASIGTDVDLLLLVHPKELPEDTQYAIDQFVLRGGRLVVFVDPASEAEQAAFGPPQVAPGGGLTPPVSSSLDRLFKAWGVAYDPHMVVRDMQNALQFRKDAQSPPASNPVLLGLGRDALDQGDIVTAQLDMVNFSSAGALSPLPNGALAFQPLARSSTKADLIPTDRVRLQSDPAQLADGFRATGTSYVIAARLTGMPASAFPERSGAGHIAKAAAPVHVIIVADTDVLTDRLWVRVQEFFGRRLLNAFAKNGDFVANAVDNLVGATDLIAVRTRPGMSRPFTRVEQLRERADQRLRAKEDELQAQLKLMESRLAELQPDRSAAGAQEAGALQKVQIAAFQQQRQRIRTELRDVRQQLNASIEGLGTRLKWLDILGVPLVLTVAALVVVWWRRRPRRSAA